MDYPAALDRAVLFKVMVVGVHGITWTKGSTKDIRKGRSMVVISMWRVSLAEGDLNACPADRGQTHGGSSDMPT